MNISLHSKGMLVVIGILCSTAALHANAVPITILANNPGTWNQWIDTGVDLLPGQMLDITATGLAATTGSSALHGPDGKAVPGFPNATESLVNSVNVGALVGMIDFPPGSIPNSPPFSTVGMYLLDDGGTGLFGPGFVGSSFSQIIPLTVGGRLYLGFNDGFDADNVGQYNVEISVTTVPEPPIVGLMIVALGLILAKGSRRPNRLLRDPGESCSPG